MTKSIFETICACGELCHNSLHVYLNNNKVKVKNVVEKWRICDPIYHDGFVYKKYHHVKLGPFEIIPEKIEISGWDQRFKYEEKIVKKHYTVEIPGQAYEEDE